MISAAKLFQALEVLSLASSVGLQAYAVLQTHQARQQAHQSQEYEFHQSEDPSDYPAQTIAPPTWASHTAICALTLAFVFSKLGRWIMHGREGRTALQPATSSSASIARLELLADRQAQSLQAVERQLTKVQLKTRVMGHDVRPTLRKVQEENMQQAQVVAVQAEQIEAIGKDLQDTQKLLSALQSVSAKQFDVLLKVMRQQQQQQEYKPKIQPVQDLQILESVSAHEA